MGEEFVCSVCPSPEITDEIKKEINLRISNLSQEVANNLVERFYHDDINSEWAHDNLRLDHLFSLDSITCIAKKEVAQSLIRDALREVVYHEDRGDVSHMILEDRWWLITGGSSWGGPPTEAMQYIDILSESDILAGLNYKQ